MKTEQRTNCFITAILEKGRFSEMVLNTATWFVVPQLWIYWWRVPEKLQWNVELKCCSRTAFYNPSTYQFANWRYLSLGHINHGSLPEQSEIGNHLCHSPCHLQTNDCRHINLQQMPSSHTQSTHRVSSKYSLGIPNRLRSWFQHNSRSHILSPRQQHQLYDSRHAWDVYRAIKCYPISSIDHPWTNANSKRTGR